MAERARPNQRAMKELRESRAKVDVLRALDKALPHCKQAGLTEEEELQIARIADKLRKVVSVPVIPCRAQRPLPKRTASKPYDEAM